MEHLKRHALRISQAEFFLAQHSFNYSSDLHLFSSVSYCWMRGKGKCKCTLPRLLICLFHWSSWQAQASKISLLCFFPSLLSLSWASLTQNPTPILISFNHAFLKCRNGILVLPLLHLHPSPCPSYLMTPTTSLAPHNLSSQVLQWPTSHWARKHERG